MGGVKSILTLLLGLFLLLTAGLKVHGLLVDPYGQENFLALPWLQLLTIEVEILLGLWLLSRWQPHLAWYVTLLFFVALAAISFTLASQGQTSCGCFGKIEVNPWYTFAFNAVIVAVMTILSIRETLAIKSLRVNPARVLVPLSIPGRGVRGEGALPGAAPLSGIFQILFTTTALLGTLAVIFTLITGDPWAALAKLRGETLAVSPAVTQLGEGTQGEQRTFQVQLKNYSDKPIKVVGGTTSCACIATQDLPITIPAGGTESINVKIKFSGSPGKFAHRFVLYSDSDERLTIARFSGSVLLPSPLRGIGIPTVS